ncbi:MAG: DUF3048 domain-containing protein [Clostridia bacterium]|nr:DUF3048 domain-containing protein [Clostridia bacterium]
MKSQKRSIIALFLVVATVIALFSVLSACDNNPKVPDETTSDAPASSTEKQTGSTGKETEATDKQTEATEKQTEATETQTEATETQTEATDKQTETQTPDVKPEYTNPLTGEAMSDDKGLNLEFQRPVAVVVGNSADVPLQYGLSSADILYEYPVEGGITRFLAVVYDYSSISKIGGIRSSRYYDLAFAGSFNAITFAAGGSTYTEVSPDYDVFMLAKKLGIFFINALEYDYEDGSGFAFRDTSIVDAAISEHNLVTTGARLRRAISFFVNKYSNTEKYGSAYSYIRSTSGDVRGFKFVEWGTKNTLDEGSSAQRIHIDFSSKSRVAFTYQNGVYTRKQDLTGDGYKDHADALTNEPLAYTNLLLIKADATKKLDMSADGYTNKNGVLDFKFINTSLSNGANGYYFTNGRVIPIIWTKSGYDSELRIFDTEGNEIEFNRGKTYIGVGYSTVVYN